jgi:glycolate oxidase subunit GlcD
LVAPPAGAEAVRTELAAIVGAAHVAPADDARLLQDATEVRRLPAHADAWITPANSEEVAAVVAWCYEHDVPVTPRGGGTGLAGGAVPLAGGIVLSLERLNRLRSFHPAQWRMHVDAGLTTGHVRRLAREAGLLFGPDPGAAERSQIGGNVATNAGGPHAFKYGVTRHWITGLEVVLAPGLLVALGGPVRKDVTGLDLTGLLVGSEGTLGIVTGAWLRLVPHPEVQLPLLCIYRELGAGIAAIEAAMASGVVPAAIEFLDAAALCAARGAAPDALPAEAAFAVIAECDGSRETAGNELAELREAMGDGAVAQFAPTSRSGVAELWRWRAAVPLAVAAQRGGKVSEDVVVPLDRLQEAIEGVVAVGERCGLPACSWGHAGDGNLHASFMVDPGSEAELERAREAADAVLDLALELGGALSGEHGVGSVKRPHLLRHFDPAILALQRAVKDAIDPKGLLNPGKKF